MSGSSTNAAPPARISAIMHFLCLRNIRRARPLAMLAAPLALLCAGCTGGQATATYSVANGGYPSTGKRLIVAYRCGECHTIPGIPHAQGVFGPPLNFMGLRTMIAGNFPNTPGNLAHWVLSPESMKPGTAMPTLGLSEKQARNVAAYLESLH